MQTWKQQHCLIHVMACIDEKGRIAASNHGMHTLNKLHTNHLYIRTPPAGGGVRSFPVKEHLFLPVTGKAHRRPNQRQIKVGNIHTCEKAGEEFLVLAVTGTLCYTGIVFCIDVVLKQDST